MNINDSLVWIVAALAVTIVIAFVAIASARRSKERSQLLKERFGPEYDRAVERFGERGGERDLVERVRHVERSRLRELSDADRFRFESAWNSIQAQFVDDPAVAVQRANALIKDVMQARGYSANEGFDQRAADLSVDHPDLVQHYRAAHALARVGTEGGVHTEDLRQAIVHYRVIFADLLQRTPPVMPMHGAPAYGRA